MGGVIEAGGGDPLPQSAALREGMMRSANALAAVDIPAWQGSAKEAFERSRQGAQRDVAAARNAAQELHSANLALSAALAAAVAVTP